jgi:hypothetical protein
MIAADARQVNSAGGDEAQGGGAGWEAGLFALAIGPTFEHELAGGSPSITPSRSRPTG